MELKDTVQMMDNADYKERFRAEYFQLKIRYVKLDKMLEKWRNNELDFEPSCPYKMLAEQLDLMWKYLVILEMRARIENVDLKEV
jgi:hypothetical protein